MQNDTRLETPFDRHAPVIGKRLFRLALEWSRSPELPGTQKEREDRIQSIRSRKQVIHGSRSKKAAREAVEAAAMDLERERRERNKRRAEMAIGVCRIDPYWLKRKQPREGRRMLAKPPRGRDAVTLPQGDLETRLHERVEASVLKELYDGYRVNGAGVDTVHLTRDPAQVGVRQSEELDLKYYKRVQYPKKVTHTRITVPRDWRLRVARAGLTRVGGMLTLDAQRLEGAPDGITVYAAVWLHQGRGYDLAHRRGYIAVGLGDNYHADTVEKALAGLRRKIGLKKADADLANALEHHGIEGIVQNHPDITVTVQDARNTGSCEYGIQSWCHRTGLPYEKGEAPLADVYQAYQKAPLPEARAAILRALRRQKKAVLKTVA
ncbi:hypothetical protein [Thioalkalivibrio sp. ALE23]|uniref:hypothetical protein n=1 Tax=Thioalkalivibrio sp. ALE23 TaxID=1265495 RepID=UPI000371BF72|nr:hypothetical protein [Thioalkalivibrio sp. ALE23]